MNIICFYISSVLFPWTLHKNINILKCDLDPYQMTLIFKIYLDVVKMYHNWKSPISGWNLSITIYTSNYYVRVFFLEGLTSIQVCRYGRMIQTISSSYKTYIYWSGSFVTTSTVHYICITKCKIDR